MERISHYATSRSRGGIVKCCYISKVRNETGALGEERRQEEGKGGMVTESLRQVIYVTIRLKVGGLEQLACCRLAERG